MGPLESLAAIYDFEWPLEVAKVLYGPASRTDLLAIDAGREALALGACQAPDSLLPLAIVDEASIACMVGPDAEFDNRQFGDIVRWRLDDVERRHQAQLLDVDPFLYVLSIAEELTSRSWGLDRILDEIGPAYEETYLANDKRPRDFIVRPIRIACQNVIVGLAAIAQDSSFDGLSVVAWQTCEVPHVAAHEANRALAALTLCDAFQNGGTMEIRFDRQARVQLGGASKVYRGHPEGQVPASLRRFGRTVGIALGLHDPGAIFPSEARELFLAVTPMPADLRERATRAIAEFGVSPERLCFTLMTQTWREPELDFLLATSRRVPSILEGGANWFARSVRQAETEVCRAALMVGMLFRRLDSHDSAGSDNEIRTIEDNRVGVSWRALDDIGAIEFRGLDVNKRLPWLGNYGGPTPGTLTVLPRCLLVDGIASTLDRLPADSAVAVLVPLDVDTLPLPERVIVLRCPERVADLDKAIESKLLTARISRG